MLKKPQLILSLNENKINLTQLENYNKKIIIKESFDDSLILQHKDLTCFNLILKLTDNNTYSMIDFIIKNSNKKYKTNRYNSNEGKNYFIIRQIFLLFIYLSKQNFENQIYKDIYKFILNIHRSLQIITINDLIEIVRFHILISLNKLINRYNTFLISINFLIDFYKELINQNIKNENEMKCLCDSIEKVLETIYKNLKNNKNNLIFLQRYEDINDLSLFNICIFYDNSNENETKLNDIINKIILLVYSFNPSKLMNENILENIKEGFFELKKGNDTKIKNIINILKNKAYMLDSLYKNENQLKENDLYFPKNYFIFIQSEESGIDYNTEFDLFNHNFILMFSFKCSNVKNDNYPLITFLNEDPDENKPEILLNISIQNNHLCLLFPKDYQEFKDFDIKSNKTYLIALEFYKNDKGNDKLKLTINYEDYKKATNFESVNYNGKVNIKLGYLNEELKSNNSQLNNLSLNFEGIMGPVLFLITKNNDTNNNSTIKLVEANNILISNIYKLRGLYDYCIYMNNNYYIKNFFLYESDLIYNEYKGYFNNLNQIKEMEYFIISPLSMQNSINKNINIFLNYFNSSEINSSNETFIKTMTIPSRFNKATYAKNSLNIIQNITKNDGIHLLCLIMEYYYNILNMIIEYTDYDDFQKQLLISNEINKALIPLLDLITQIINYSNIDFFKDELDTFGFCLMKTLNLLGDKSNLKNELIHCLMNNVNILIKYYNGNKERNRDKCNIIKDFINKLFILICNHKYFDTTNSKLMKNVFIVFQDIIRNNDDLMTYDIFNSIIHFSFLFTQREKIKEGEEEYKLMKREYKSLISLFFNQIQSINFYIDFLKLIPQNILNIKVKYILLKIFYKANKIESLINIFNDTNDNTKNEINKEKANERKNSKRGSYDIVNKKNDKNKKKREKPQKEQTETKEVFFNLEASLNIMNIYKKLFDDISSIKNKKKPSNEKFQELIKGILILLISEQASLIMKAYPEKKYYFFSKEQLSKAKEEDKEIIRKIVKHKSCKIPEYNLDEFKNTIISSETTNSDNINYLFEKILNGNNISYFKLRTLFVCLFDTQKKTEKFNIMKDEKYIDYEKLNSMFGEFNKHKKELFSQILDLIDLIKDEDEKYQTINLICNFLLQTIDKYKSIETDMNILPKEIESYKKQFFHLFESKLLLNKILNIYMSNPKLTSDDTFTQNITKICVNTLQYHPKPFVFSFLKRLIQSKEQNKYFTIIINGIVKYIDANLKIDSALIKDETNPDDNIIKRSFVLHLDEEEEKEIYEINSYLYFNEIRFIKFLIKIFKTYPNEIKIILEENEYKLLNILEKLISGFLSSKFIYDINLYIFHPSSLLKKPQNLYEKVSIKDKKSKEKNSIKLLQTTKAKLLSNQILFIDILELSFLVIYNLCAIPSINNNNDLLKSFIIKIYEKIYIDGHFISYYLDIFNSKNVTKNIKASNMNKLIIENNLEEIPKKYYHWIDKNIKTKDNRIFSFLSFLVFLKYQSLMMNYNDEENNINSSNVKKIFDLFGNTFNSPFQIDLFEIMKYVSKIKDRKMTEIILEKEELNNKEFRTQKTYYKLLKNFLSKNKNLNTENFSNFRNDLKNKYIKDEEENSKSLIKQKEINEIKIESSSKRKDSFNIYFQEEDDQIIINSQNQNNKTDTDNNINNAENSKNTIINQKIQKANNNKNNINFFYAKKPILCTKRDLILKNFGFYFFDEYFKDERFIKMKNYFMELYPPSDPKNKYNDFEKQMTFNFPSILKNFINSENYFPRLFLRPDRNFFKHKNFHKSHKYLKLEEQQNELNNNIYNYIINEDSIPIMHFEYSHGLLKQDNFNLFTMGNTKENISISTKSFQCEYINNKCTIIGKIKLIKNWIVFQIDTSFDFSFYENIFKYRLASRKEDIEKKQKQIIIPLNSIKEIIFRNFLFYTQALEIFLFNGKSYLFNLYEYRYLKDFIQYIKGSYESFNINLPEIIRKPDSYFREKNYTNDWLENKLSTLEYLLLINKFAGRSYNDLTQYLIFPWVLKDYSDIKDPNNFRQMKYSMAIQEDSCLEQIKKEYDKDRDIENRSYFVYHYSNSANICLYLLRLNPFTYNQIKLNGHFDSPDRQIESMQDMCYVLREFKETSELVPEYFFMVECFLNLNYNYFGIRNASSSKKSLVNNITLNIDFTSLLEMILFHKNFINSNVISSDINNWIDNIFGENQNTSKVNVINSFPKGCYAEYVKPAIDKIVSEIENCNLNSTEYSIKVKGAIKEIKSLTDHAYLFGQCPFKLFEKSHPEKINQASDSNDESDEIESKILNNILVPTKDILYLDCKSGNDNLFILSMNEILIYNKLLEPKQTIRIKRINKIFYSSKKEKENEDIILSYRFLYKNLIFEIDDCKIFFVGGYLDNSLLIYHSNNKNNVSYLSIMMESRITCMKKIPYKNIFLTGHLNGKIIKWKYDLLSNENKEQENKEISEFISLKKIMIIIGHKSFVQNIDVNEQLNIIISASNDGIIMVRKLYDLELLSVIRYNTLNKSLLDLCFDNQIIIATYYNIKEKDDNNKKVKVITYSVNGIKLGNVKKNITMPLIIKDSNDKLIIFINKILYEVYVTFKEWDNICDLNKGKTKNSEIITYGYDNNEKLIFCLLENGRLVKLSIKQ